MILPTTTETVGVKLGTNLEHNLIPVYSEVSPILFNGTYSHESMFRIAAVELV